MYDFYYLEYKRLKGHTSVGVPTSANALLANMTKL